MNKNDTDQFNLLRKINKNSGYDPKRGIENINYANAIDPALVCENINSLVNFPKHFYRKEIELLPEVHQAVKDYVSYLYDPSWKKQQDRWIIEHGALELVLNNIPFIMIPTMSLWQAHMPPKELEKPKILDEKYYIMKREYCQLEVSSMPEYSIDMELDPGYHTTYEGQEYLADKYEQLIKERLNLC